MSRDSILSILRSGFALLHCLSFLDLKGACQNNVTFPQQYFLWFTCLFNFYLFCVQPSKVFWQLLGIWQWHACLFSVMKCKCGDARHTWHLSAPWLHFPVAFGWDPASAFLAALVFIRKESAKQQKCWPKAISVYNEQHSEVGLVFVCVLCRTL